MAKAAAVPVPFATAHYALFDVAKLRAEETVLIQGAAGSVGLATVQLAARGGAKVLTVQAGAERIARLRELGAARVIDRNAEMSSRLCQRRLKATWHLWYSTLSVERRLRFLSSLLSRSVECCWSAMPFKFQCDLNFWPAMTANISLLGVSLRASFSSPATKAVVQGILKQVRDGET